jgi:integrase
MSVYRPKYKDQKTGELKEQRVWWYHFVYAGRHIQESSKSTRKTIAAEAEKKRRLELEKGFNQVGDNRRERIRSISELAKEFLEAYELRNPRSVTSVKYALGHVTRKLGKSMMVDIDAGAVKRYQTDRLREKAAPKTINEETGNLLKLLGEYGDLVRAKLKRENALRLRVRTGIARAYAPDEKQAMLEAARTRRSPAIYPALMLALHVGLRDAEIRDLQWSRIDLCRAILTVGDAKTEAGQGRTVPLNADVMAALVAHSKWYLDKFGETRSEWYVFPFGRPQPTDPTRSVTTFKTVWTDIRRKVGVKGRWHDNRHTFITDLAESGEASDETIQDLAGHVSKRMLGHYSHIRMQAKRRAVDALVLKPVRTLGTAQDSSRPM